MSYLYAFVSMSTRRYYASEAPGKNVGVCVIQWTDWDGDDSSIHDKIVKRCEELKLVPPVISPYPLDYSIFGLDQGEFEEQGLELNHLYSKAELNDKGFEKL